MQFQGITALAGLLAAVLGAAGHWPLWMCLAGFLICFCAVALAWFAATSGRLFRALAAGAALTAALASAAFGSAWTFEWVFLLADSIFILLALVFLWAICRRVDPDVPQEEDDPFYRRIMYLYIEALMNLVLVRLHTRGLENTPREGRFLLVCNHLFLADPGILHHCFQKSQIAFITKQENYQLPFVGAFLHKTLCQSIDRENDRQALKTILRCIQLLKNDRVSVGVFPEGYTSRDGKLHPFRPGVFKIAQKAGVPIVVCTIQGTREIFRNLRQFKKTDVHLHLVEVIPPEAIQGKSTVAISEEIYEKMLTDLGEEFRYKE